MRSDLHTPQPFIPLIRFETNALQQPDAIAVVCGNDHFSYNLLNYCANQLTRYLQAKGIGPENIVGLYLERSFYLVVAILGIMKSGGAILPLEPSYPHIRIRFMLEDAKPSMVLTQEHLQERVDGVPVLCMNEVWKEITGQGCTAFESGLVEGHLHVVFYTSGSTGAPKGVLEVHKAGPQPDDLGSHNNPENTPSLKFRSTDRVVVKCPISFAPSLWEILEPLHAGGTLVVMEPGGERDFPHLVRLIIEQQVTMVHFVPSALRLFLDEPFVKECSSLERVICSGESLSNDCQQQFFHYLNTKLYLYYAATEAPAAALLHLHPKDCEHPITFGCGNTTKVYVLTSEMAPAPHGHEGEVYVEAKGKIRGYLGQPGLTAEKFLPDPLSSEPGSRLFQTGDTGCYLPDHSIKIMGRRDHQIKLRGYRIELGEIVAILEQHPSVRQAVVLARDITPGDKRLVAYIVPQKDGRPSSEELQTALAARLPDYMVPSRYVLLEAFPLTPNGKVDRRGLPAPQQIDRGQPTAYEPPRSPLEHLLVELWTDLLKIDEIGVHDNFFALGGHSLLATRVVARLRTMLDLDLPVRTLFEQPTIAELAGVLDAQLTNAFPDWPADE